jgi:hypothetical protein
MGFAVAGGQRVVVRPLRVTQVEELLMLRPTLEEALAAVEGDDPRESFSWWTA